MRIRPPELGTSICDVKYHVSLSTGCVLGKWVCLVTLVMSLFDLQDVCIVIGSLATLDLPMVVDLIGIYELKGPYCTLTTTNWFLQALSEIPRGSWGDVARRFTMIHWASPKFLQDPAAPPPKPHARPSPTAAPPPSVRHVIGLVSITATRSFRPCQNSSVLLVQADEGFLIPIVDLIRRIYRRQQFKSKISLRILDCFNVLNASRGIILISTVPPEAGSVSAIDANSGIRAQARILQYIIMPYCIRSRNFKNKIFFGSPAAAPPLMAAPPLPPHAHARAITARFPRLAAESCPLFHTWLRDDWPTTGCCSAHWLRDGWGRRRAAMRREWHGVAAQVAAACGSLPHAMRCLRPPPGESPAGMRRLFFLLGYIRAYPGQPI
ncbi:hypothetical protein F511_22271 [Dorcoceras hygrometricum]|uniref:Uncharacterized protein n=1 Tax=Dorcoceras hygrometricum TaxID=472368 RepID=A0A2Z7CKD6_9LAMI|nr:hypothetical protein F511_22271 [Dorcoceras hygrometricum]